MKKLMFVAALAAAMTGFSDVTSANICGYNNMKTVDGSRGIGTCFLAIGREGKMGDLSVTGYGDEDYEAFKVYANKLDEFGRNDGATMFWVDVAEYTYKGKTYPAVYGWWDKDEEISYADVSLKAGEGLWFSAPSTDFKVVSSGEVLNDTLPITLVDGSLMCPNPTPVQLKMVQLNISGYGDEDYEAFKVYANKLDEFGRNDGATMFWVDVAEYTYKGKTYPAVYGWWDKDEETSYADITVDPGESLWMSAPSTDFILTWPNPLVKNEVAE